MRYVAVVAAKAATVTAWVLTGVDVLPEGWGWDLRPDVALYLVAAGCVGSYWCITRAHARPVDEVFNAGVALGRLQVERELTSPTVTRLSEQQPATAPSLRIVAGASH